PLMRGESTNEESPMHTEPSVRPVATRKSSAGRGVVTAVALALLGYGIVTIAERPNLALNSVAHSGVTSAAIASTAAVEESATSTKEAERVPNGPGSQAQPRECDSAKGISSDCVFE